MGENANEKKKMPEAKAGKGQNKEIILHHKKAGKALIFLFIDYLHHVH